MAMSLSELITIQYVENGRMQIVSCTVYNILHKNAISFIDNISVCVCVCVCVCESIFRGDK